MAEFIKKFANPAAADQYAINDIPFITSVDGDPIQNLHCNLSGKKLVNTGGIVSVQNTGPVIPNNEIWYTTTDNEIYDLGGIIETLVSAGGTYNGPAVVSNEYDKEKQMYCITFDDNVTVLGDINTGTKTAEGPFFATYPNYGIVCNVETIILPKTITRIGDNAFWGCDGLTTIDIPNSVTNIGGWAFEHCSGLTSVTIPNSVTSIGWGTFLGCTGLTSPVYNAHVFAFMPYSYSGAYTIPNGIETIGGGAFYECYGLTSIIIPNSVTSIGEEAFRECTSLTSVTIGNSVTSIGEDAFFVGDNTEGEPSYPGSLQSITVVDGQTYNYNGEETFTITLANGTDVTLYMWYKEDEPTEVSVTIEHEDGPSETVTLSSEETYTGQGYDGYYSQDTYDSNEGESASDFLVDNNYPEDGDTIYDYCNDTYEPEEPEEPEEELPSFYETMSVDLPSQKIDEKVPDSIPMLAGCLGFVDGWFDTSYGEDLEKDGIIDWKTENTSSIYSMCRIIGEQHANEPRFRDPYFAVGYIDGYLDYLKLDEYYHYLAKELGIDDVIEDEKPGYSAGNIEGYNTHSVM